MPTVSKYNPKSIRRCVRVDEVHDDGIVTWKTKSFTRPGDEVVHHPAIDFSGRGSVTCDCENFRYRLAKYSPTIHTPEHHCKHIAQALSNLRRKAQ